MDMVQLLTADLHDSTGDTDDCGILRHFTQDHRIGRDAGIIADFEGPKDLRAGADHHIVPEGRMSLSYIFSGAAQRHILIKQAIITDLSRLTDHDAGAMVDDQSPADRRAGMDLDTGKKFGHLTEPAGQKAAVMQMQPMGDAVVDRRMKAIVQKEDLDAAPCCRVIPFVCADIL